MNNKDLKELELAYKQTFSSETGKKVLEDLKKDAVFILLHILKVIVMKAHF